jgi:hypothetical protein
MDTNVNVVALILAIISVTDTLTKKRLRLFLVEKELS